MPAGAPASTRRWTRSARSAVQVGWPTWSSTTSTRRARAATRTIVLGKHRRGRRTATRCGRRGGPGAPLRTAHSPAAFVRPYAEAGGGRASTAYGLVAVAVEDVVGGDLHEPGAVPSGCAASDGRADRVDREGRGSSVSASSTAVYAAQLTTTSSPGDPRVAPGSVTSSSARLRGMTCSPRRGASTQVLAEHPGRTHDQPAHVGSVSSTASRGDPVARLVGRPGQASRPRCASCRRGPPRTRRGGSAPHAAR